MKSLSPVIAVILCGLFYIWLGRLYITSVPIFNDAPADVRGWGVLFWPAIFLVDAVVWFFTLLGHQ